MLVLAVPSTLGQVGAIVAGGLIGWVFLPGEAIAFTPLPVRISRLWSIGAIVLFFALLFGLPLVVSSTGSHALAVFDAFYRSGSLVFGGGHVVLPLLQAATVQPGWVGNDAFLAGYGAAQAVPGPLFTFAAYLGTVMNQPPNGWTGGLLVPRRHLPAVVLPAIGAAAVLELVPPASGDALGAEGRERRRGRPAAGRALHAGLDQRDPRAGRLRDRRRGPAAARLWKAPPWLVVILGAAAAFAVTLRV